MTGAEAVLNRLDNGRLWIKDDLGNHSANNTPVCLLGAMISVVAPGRTYLAIRDTIRDEYPDRALTPIPGCPDRCSIPSFNNHPDTTWDDITRVLTKAADRD